MSMVLFRGKYIDSSKVIGFDVTKPVIKVTGPDGKNWTAGYSSVDVVVNMFGDNQVKLFASTPAGCISGLFSEITLDPVVVNCLSDKSGILLLKYEHIKSKAIQKVGELSAELLKKICAEWNELTMQQGGEA